jgi:signal transduction histidine kinase
MEVDVHSEAVSEHLADDVKVCLYRIVQEALTNASKHAPNSHTEVLVRYELDAVSISVIDDGNRGSSGGVAPPGLGRGLIGMRERVAVLGGDIQIGPEDGAGFCVRARLPAAKKT